MSEKFTDEQAVDAIRSFLEYGEQTYSPNGDLCAGHKGYFSGDGWAARCLRAHYEKLRGVVMIGEFPAEKLPF